MGCFNINQVLLWDKDFDRNNLTRWCGKNLLIKLRNQYYAFPEYKEMPDFSRYVANQIYAPSYISLQSALSFYGMIPEEVVQQTSVTTRKTARFENEFGTFHYQNVKTRLFFGYERKTMQNGRGLYFATPEKALLDLLYLNPFYKTDQDFEELRLDEYFMHTELNLSRLNEYIEIIASKTLEQKMRRIIKLYGI